MKFMTQLNKWNVIPCLINVKLLNGWVYAVLFNCSLKCSTRFDSTIANAKSASYWNTLTNRINIILAYRLFQRPNRSLMRVESLSWSGSTSVGQSIDLEGWRARCWKAWYCFQMVERWDIEWQVVRQNIELKSCTSRYQSRRLYDKISNWKIVWRDIELKLRATGQDIQLRPDDTFVEKW